MPVDYRSLEAGFYWVRWKEQMTIGQWHRRKADWVKGLLGVWGVMPPSLPEGMPDDDGHHGIAHVWEPELVAEGLEVVGPIASVGVVRFRNLTRYKLDVAIAYPGDEGGSPDRITVVVREQGEAKA